MLLHASVQNYLYLMVFHGSLSESKFPEVSKIRLIILPNLNNAIVWMVSARSQISISFNPFSNLLGLFRAHQLKWYHCHIHVPYFFSSQEKSWYLSLFSLSIIFTLWFTGTATSTLLMVLILFLFFFSITLSSYLAEIRWSVYISKFQKILASHSPGRIPCCAYSSYL